MIVERYNTTTYDVQTILSWINAGQIAIPEIQRPFVWSSTKVRNLLDSLYRGYPIGYMITWQNPDMKLKNGILSEGKRILIDGQQRITALMSAILGHEIVTEDYESKKIRIAFNPQTERFEVRNPAIAKDSAWIDDIAEKIFAPDVSSYSLINQYKARNPNIESDDIAHIFDKIKGLANNRIGFIELASDLDIDTVTEIFIRVNSAGTELSQADFAMSKIAVNENYGGNTLRKAIDYFCHLAVNPHDYKSIKQKDRVFAETDYFNKMSWLKNENDDLYDPEYTDMLRVAFTSEFSRGRLKDLVALLSGRNFETKEYVEIIAEESFTKLKTGIFNFMNETNFKNLVMILRSAGFLKSNLITSKNAVNFTYIIYLKGRKQGMESSDLQRLIRRWFALSVLRGRYSGNPESVFDQDIRMIESQGLSSFTELTINNELTPSFWTGMLPQQMETSSSRSPYFIAYQAAQVCSKDKGFLSTNISVADLLLHKGDKHHLFPRNYLKKKGMKRGKYNQIANYAIAQSEINITISDTPPEVYFARLKDQCNGSEKYYGGITDESELRENFRQSCIPEGVLDGKYLNYDEFLIERRKLMSAKIRKWFESL